MLSVFKRQSVRQLGLKHRRIQPYTPRIYGKAEGVIRTAINEWAYAHVFQNSANREAPLPFWPHQYNWYTPVSTSFRQSSERLSMTTTS